MQDVPAGSWVATAKVAHATINADGKAAGLALINQLNPNYLLKTTVQYKGDTDPNTAGNQPGKWAERVLTANNQSVILPPATVPWPNSGGLAPSGDFIWVRFVYDDATKTITTWSSTNGTTFASFGAPISVTQYLSQPGGLRVGVFAKHDAGAADDIAQFDAFNVVSGADPQTPGDDCGGTGQCPQVDEFNGTALDPKWEIVNPTPANLAVGGGNLTLTSAQATCRARTSRPATSSCRRCPTVRGRSRPSSTTTAIKANGAGGRPGAVRPAEPELLRQDGDPVQEHRPLRPAAQRHLGGAGADRQRHRSARLRRPVSEHRQAHAAGERPLAPAATTART